MRGCHDCKHGPLRLDREFRCDRERLMLPDPTEPWMGPCCLNWQPMSIDDPRRVKSYQQFLCGTRTSPLITRRA
jgi:hypothetical protein